MALAGFALSLPMQARQRPNIVLFLVDDMGWQETSVPFWEHPTPLNNRYHTPNMERLANMGVKFTQAYACAISSPSRCSLLSGMNAARHRVTNWTIHFNRTTDSPNGTVMAFNQRRRRTMLISDELLLSLRFLNFYTIMDIIPSFVAKLTLVRSRHLEKTLQRWDSM